MLSERNAPSTPRWAHQQESSPSLTPRHRTPPPVKTPPTRVPAVKQQIEQNLDAYLETGGMELPSFMSLGADKTFQGVFHKNEVEFRFIHRKLLEEKGVNVKATAVRTEEKAAQHKTASLLVDAATTANDPSYFRPTPPMNHMALSSIPNNQQHNVTDAHDGGNDDDGDDHTDTGVDDDFLLACVQDEYDDRSLVSGLTTVSGEAFLRKEHNAIRQMMLQDVDNDEESSEEYHSEIGSIAAVAVDQAENMVQEMRIMLEEFNLNNPASNESDHEITPKKEETAISRDNCHKWNTNETQWEPPSNMITGDGDDVGDGDSTSISEQTNTEVALSHDHAVPESYSEQYRIKYATYRRQLRKARRRRVMGRMAAVTAILTLILVGVAIMFRKTAAPPTRPSIVDRLHQRQRLQQQHAKEMAAAAAAMTEQYCRPWFCNVPLAYIVHRRCHRLASKTPFLICMRSSFKHSRSSTNATMMPLCAVQQDDVIVLVLLLLLLSRQTMMRNTSQPWF